MRPELELKVEGVAADTAVAEALVADMAAVETDAAGDDRDVRLSS
jgi:hypothetical protein